MDTKKEILNTANQIAEKMKEKGYEYFNIKGGASGNDFKTSIASYLHYASFNNSEPTFPIYAGSGVAATSPANPYTWATFKIVEDAEKGLRIDTMDISMYECYDGALRTHLELQIKSLDDIPSKQNAAKLIEEKWEKRYHTNQSMKSKPKGRKM